MTIRCIFYCSPVYFITICLLNLINTNAKEVRSFQTTCGTRIPKSESTVDVNSASLIECALECLSSRQCCLASFCTGTSTCRIDTSEKCCLNTETMDGWSTVRRNIHLPLTNTRSTSFGNSMYSIIEGLVEWEKAKESCKYFGGKLLELETSEENEFIKNEVRIIGNTVEGYWVGGYNFNQDHDMEWISKPSQVMPFSDMGPYQPNEPKEQLCLGIWRVFDFRWGDHYCDYLLSYICEFHHQ